MNSSLMIVSRFPNSTRPVSIIHYVNSSSDVNGTVDYQTTVTVPGSNGGNSMAAVYEDHWHKPNASLPRAVCFADTGCSAGASDGHQMFLSEPRKIAHGPVNKD